MITDRATEWHTCPLCGTVFIGWGNNPEPLMAFEDGPCCDDCNWLKVIPARLSRLWREKGRPS